MAPDLAAALAALGSEVRLNLVLQLRQPRRLADLRAVATRSSSRLRGDRPLSRQAVVEHLERLVEAGFVEARRVGSGTEYVAVPAGLAAVVARMSELFAASMAPAHHPPGTLADDAGLEHAQQRGVASGPQRALSATAF